ncbi:Heterokaryon incompatibility protein 6, OR allele [Coniochaeta hoffmannii]|uniref:Heterokaryon incompatibility protein 6, OR allele n=1 Tax=Coniochaeta hoffmannii TaxID=91930 RepID=A0AA38VNJ4_9PEZI|nr:Heterokaryon incompatibility protein 6, OR allele [Coniochaeta hoffmannii]
MSSSTRATSQVYGPLPNATSIRVLLLAPGDPGDAEVVCWLLPCDLDWDHERFPSTAPRPVESISLGSGKLASGERRKFSLRLDTDLDHEPKERMHPFQRYEALSYVWGDPRNHEQVTVDGEVVPVTVNLYEALYSLRLLDAGRRLWVDALCINQSDHKEKEVQIGLMRRVYQQAEKVIAYLPLSPRDQKHIGELVPKILQASRLCVEERQRMEREGPGQYTGVFNSVGKLETAEVATDESAPLGAIHTELSKKQVFLEDFGLPPENSPLWASWRRLFASPYFTRIWILQEIVLAKNLEFWFGHGGTSKVLELIVAHHLLGEYSGAMNMRYMASVKQLSDEHTETALKAARVGSQSAARMFGERLVAQGGSGSTRRRLIEKLPMVTNFQATDPRDKIYALLGLTRDGASFAPHVSYADSTDRVFLNFAKLFIERGEGIQVLLQAGLRDDDQDRWPSWVPHWDGLGQFAEGEAVRSSGKSSTRILVGDDSQTLHISGSIIDDIKTLSTSMLETLSLTSGGVSMTGLIGSLVAGFKMAFETSTTRDPEQLFERLFQVLVQPHLLGGESMPRQDTDPATPPLERLTINSAQRAPSSSIPPTSSPLTPNDTTNDPASSPQIRIFRTGFHEFLNYVVTLQTQLANLTEGVTQLVGHDKPNEYHAFLRRAMSTTAHRRLCVTRDGRIGVAPQGTKVGDCVVLFEGCGIHFVVRRVRGTEKKKGTMTDRLLRRIKGKELREGEGRYRLVGPAYFSEAQRNGGRSSRSGVQKIVIV